MFRSKRRKRIGYGGTYVNLITSSPIKSLAKAERRPGAREEGLAATEYDRVEVDLILIDQTQVAQASRQLRSSNFDLPGEPNLHVAYHSLEIIRDKGGVGAD